MPPGRIPLLSKGSIAMCGDVFSIRFIEFNEMGMFSHVVMRTLSRLSPDSYSSQHLNGRSGLGRFVEAFFF